MDLRPYQVAAVEGIFAAWQQSDRTLLVLPTGTGKTIVFAHVIRRLVAEGKRCLVLAHRGELLDQARDKLKASTGLECAVEKADLSAERSHYRVTVGSVQTLMREDRLARFSPHHYDAIIVDEAHHVLAESYQRILSYFEDAKVLGVTATPDRGDLRNLGECFESIAFEYSLPRAIKDGFLCKISALTIPLKIDLSAVKATAGDLQPKSLGSILDPYLEQIADQMIAHCLDRKTVVFMPLISTSQKMAALLSDRGFAVREVNGESRDRKEILGWTNENGEQVPGWWGRSAPGSVLCNSMLLTEGWDSPEVDCVVCLRPTKIRSLYAQIVGRGTRMCEGKKDLLLLDFLWHTGRHELARPAHLICETDEVADAMISRMDGNAGVELDLEEEKEGAEGDAIDAREMALAKQLEALKRRKQKLVDPLQFEMSILDADLANYEPRIGAELNAPSEGQRGLLEQAGILPDTIESAGKAAKILEALDSRRKKGLATPKQIRLLERRGFSHVGQWSFRAARSMIDRMAASGWRIPAGVNPREYQPEAS